ncbi:hypothetical protein ATCC90586_004651 [Pythium insidiosum]|nr:hypothetical protein ATCC90586_004651 [Pythium insidiosum]
MALRLMHPASSAGKPAAPPAPSDVEPATTLFDRLYALYGRVQVSRRGQYSVERLLALDEYIQTRSLAHVLAVLVAVPLPALALIVAIDALPLRPLEDGWRADDPLWLRAGLSMLVSSEAMARVGLHCIPTLQLSRGAHALLILGTVAVYVAAMASLGRLRYPFPFSVAVCTAPGVAAFVALYLGAIAHTATPHERQQFRVFLLLCAAQGSMLMVYPTFGAVFVALKGSPVAQTALLLLLPVLKLVLRNGFARICRPWEDLLPKLTVFSVDVFNALYLVTCLQDAGSWVTTAIIVALDVAQLGLLVYGLHRRARLLQAMRQDLAKLRRQTTEDVLLVPMTVRLVAHDDSLRHSSGVRLLACVPHASARLRLGAVAPRPLDAEPGRVEASSQPSVQVQVLQQSMKLLFQSEFIALAEYVECVVPVVYAVYLLALAQLPNLQYYPRRAEIARTDLSGVLLNFGGYAALESASLLVLHAVMRRRFGLSLLHQLAFVVETHRTIVQANLTVWILVLIQFTLVHLGADYEQLFRWITGGG